ncbi:hypothetical protein GCM10010918_12910 [Paenibacillus radicis (ex Gao et al. 2016)]|uniref:Uncharacterized protein n=1 Tax=Paenibacillus radicis (ex Gao et al. 2016) TaxID=1737354 RepID=A0A917GXM7_9BACL|nr:hypothetical protein GCM10010918_12910 [Paenibacillus radicis (ex Gao et al. 2016)]
MKAEPYHNDWFFINLIGENDRNDKKARGGLLEKIDKRKVASIY